MLGEPACGDSKPLLRPAWVTDLPAIYRGELGYIHQWEPRHVRADNPGCLLYERAGFGHVGANAFGYLRYELRVAGYRPAGAGAAGLSGRVRGSSAVARPSRGRNDTR